MRFLLYFLVSIAATTAGSMTGMGGGVIIKPVLDLLGHYDVASINMLSCITVLSMAVVSVGKQIRQKAKLQTRIAIPLALAAVAGGNAGQWALQLMIGRMEDKSVVTVVQNAVLLALIVLVIAYIRNKHRIKAMGMTGVVPSLIVGFVLGVLSSYLGIGGGPINVALLILVFSFDTGTAAVYSLITILFSQLSKFLSVLFTAGLAAYDLSMLVPMIVGAVAGGFIGTAAGRKMSEQKLDTAFNAVQIAVMCICIVNIVRVLTISTL